MWAGRLVPRRRRRYSRAASAKPPASPETAMRRAPLVRCVALVAGLFVCPLLSGCLVPVGAAWPSVAVTPPLQVSAAADQVHAFRVEVCDVSAPAESPEPSEYVLSE